MIVAMKKTYCVCRQDDRQAMLDTLGSLGVLHIAPVDPDKAVAAEATLGGLDRLARAMQILSELEPAGPRPDVEPLQAAEETLEIQREQAELTNRLAAMHRQIEQLAPWGDTRLEQIAQLRTAGIEPRFFAVAADKAGEVQGELVQTLGQLPGGRVLLAVVSRGQSSALPDGATELPLPDRDRPTLRDQAAQIDRDLHSLAARQRQLAHLADAMRQVHQDMSRQAQFTAADRSGLQSGPLYAIQGWVPSDKAGHLAQGLEQAGIAAAVQTFDPQPDEQPPTLVRYPFWANPIKALFKILGTTPGYREYDLAPFFMLAMPIFTAMLVGDAGYGLLFVLAGVLGYRKLAGLGGKSAPQLIIIFGVATVIWGVLTGNYFGVSPKEMLDAGGALAPLGSALGQVDWLWREDAQAGRTLIIKISFALAVIHLVTSHLRQAIGLFPNQKFLAEVGWCSFLVGMFGVVWLMFDPSAPVLPVPVILTLFGVGAGLIVLFSFPNYGVVKRLGIGIIGNVMPMLNTFGDTISYIRLMAVGLASYYIAAAFNGLAASVAAPHPALWIAGALVLVLAHSMNIVLCLIAIFAHGVRLNMLEFSGNAGVQWTGYPYRPFAMAATNEGDA